MPRIAGKVYPKPTRGSRWQNGVDCVKEWTPWSAEDLAFNLERKNAGWSYKDIQRVLLRRVGALRLKVMQSRREAANPAGRPSPRRSPAASRAGSKRAGKKPVKAPHAAPRAASRAGGSSRAAAAAVKTSRSASASSGSSSPSAAPAASPAAVKASPPAACPPASKYSAAELEGANILVAFSGGVEMQQRLPERPAPATTRAWPRSAEKLSISFITNQVDA